MKTSNERWVICSMNDKAKPLETTAPKIIGRKKPPEAKDAFTAHYAALNSSIKEIHESLVSGEKVRNTLPEDIFKNYFLPMFAGLETHPDASVGVWISIAGTPFAEVDIIDNSRQVLFTVPPIFERNIVDPTKPNTIPLSVVTDTVEKMIKQSPYRAVAFLNRHLSEITFKDEVLAGFQQKNFARMDEIFKRYGVTPIWEQEKPKTTVTGAVGRDGVRETLNMSFDEEIL